MKSKFPHFRVYTYLKYCALILLVGMGISASPAARASTGFLDFKYYGLTSPCDGNCAFHVYTGQFVQTSMTSIFSLDAKAIPSLNSFAPPWRWDLKKVIFSQAHFRGALPRLVTTSILKQRSVSVNALEECMQPSYGRRFIFDGQHFLGTIT